MPTRRTVLLGALAVGLSACTNPERGTAPTPASTPTPSAGGSPSASAEPSATPTGTPEPSPEGPLRVGEPQEIITGLTTPWGVRALDQDRLLVSERDTGQIKLVQGGAATSVGEVAGVRANNEAGLLGIELSADQQTLFVYTTTSSDNRVLAYSFNGSAIANPRVLLQGIPSAGIHNGGQLKLGPDGHLYISTGDASQRQQAQNQQSVAGKILRIATDGSIPGDNPFGNAVWSLGHRNVQGLTFAPNGDLWSAEFGEKSADEINLIVRGGNYGWPDVEGNNGQRVPYLAPKKTWEPTATSSPSALAYARGNLWVAALMGHCLFQVPVNGTELGEQVIHFQNRYGRIRAVTPWRDGIVFGSSNTDGRATPRAGDDRLLYLPLS
ncbi:PQQ-dependent sugar dehydrogenase [Granulicoccus phenolivorans]|uniref:PQQ-dependent sugar dehydrogenase n=1 Tax=Granulicoccus phenolivorans TaxID=266854 RepID=UPI0003FFB32C|nr:PQQ-dependent sugar dehydrogenase [Granulicoccus phenolivorans]